LNFSARSLVIALGFFILPAAAFGDVYFSANFSGQLGSSANIRAPFAGNGFNPSDTFTGNFVYDVSLIPSSIPSSGANVFFSAFPDIALISPPTAFTLSIGGLTFTLDNAQVQSPTQEAAIQYNNSGAFNGFFYVSDFTFTDGNPYELSIQGTSLSIVPIVGGFPTFSHKVNGTVFTTLTNVSPFNPQVSTTPEPSSILLFVTGLLGIIFVMRQRA
jgi:hypothetical protein